MDIEQFSGSMKLFNKKLEGFMPLLTPTGIILGLLLGSTIAWMKPAVSWLFAFITFLGGTSICFRDFGNTLKKPVFLIGYALCSYIMMPLLAKFGASLIFPDSAEIVSGFVLLRAIPAAVSGTIWATIYSGNMAVCLSILVLDTFLAPVLTPFIFSTIAGTAIEVDSMGMVKSLVMMVVIPSILGMAAREYKSGKINNHVTPILKPFSKIFLLFVIMINTAQVSERLIENASWQYVAIALSSLGLAILGFILSFYIGKLLRLNGEDSVALTFSVAMRNISAALVLAIDYLPADAALPCIFGIVFQQSLCALMGNMLYRKRHS